MKQPKHFLQFTDLSAAEYQHLFERAQVLKRRQVSGELY